MDHQNETRIMHKVHVASNDIDLRRGIDYIGVTVCFVVHDGNGRILLQKRSQTTRDEQGRWDIGGGAVEFSEPLHEAVKREISEELLTEPLEIRYLGVYEALRDNNGTPTHWMAFVHGVKVDPNDVQIGEPHKIDEIAWFTPDNLPKPVHSQLEKSLAIAKQQGIV